MTECPDMIHLQTGHAWHSTSGAQYDSHTATNTKHKAVMKCQKQPMQMEPLTLHWLNSRWSKAITACCSAVSRKWQAESVELLASAANRDQLRQGFHSHVCTRLHCQRRSHSYLASISCAQLALPHSDVHTTLF